MPEQANLTLIIFPQNCWRAGGGRSPKNLFRTYPQKNFPDISTNILQNFFDIAEKIYVIFAIKDTKIFLRHQNFSEIFMFCQNFAVIFAHAPFWGLSVHSVGLKATKVGLEEDTDGRGSLNGGRCIYSVNYLVCAVCSILYNHGIKITNPYGTAILLFPLLEFSPIFIL